MLDHGRVLELLVKEALHIQMTPSEERFNQNGGLEIQGRGREAIFTDLWPLAPIACILST